MSKPDKELAADILIAALSSKAVQPKGVLPQAQAESLMEMYAIILSALEPAPRAR